MHIVPKSATVVNPRSSVSWQSPIILQPYTVPAAWISLDSEIPEHTILFYEDGWLGFLHFPHTESECIVK